MVSLIFDVIKPMRSRSSSSKASSSCNVEIKKSKKRSSDKKSRSSKKDRSTSSSSKSRSSSRKEEQQRIKRASLESHSSEHTAQTTQILSVSFRPKVRCVKSLHLNDFTQEEKKACWYEQSEYRTMKRSVDFMIGQMEQPNNPALIMMHQHSEKEGSESAFCTRGLENRTRQAKQDKRDTIEAAKFAVLEEQELQLYSTGSVGEELDLSIAAAYAAKSKASALAARQRGIEDEEVAKALN